MIVLTKRAGHMADTHNKSGCVMMNDTRHMASNVDGEKDLIRAFLPPTTKPPPTKRFTFTQHFPSTSFLLRLQACCYDPPIRPRPCFDTIKDTLGIR